jgi:hypothetical protein
MSLVAFFWSLLDARRHQAGCESLFLSIAG